MSQSYRSVKLVFGPNVDQRAIAEAKDRGVLSQMLVELDDSRLYPVMFYTISRLQFELEESARHGQPFIAEAGMIVLCEITPAAMERAVQGLVTEGYFDYMIPLTQEQIAKANPLHWPP